MTNKETVHRNLSLTFDFVKHLIDRPELIKNISDKSELEFFEKGLKEDKEVLSKINGSKRSFVKVRNSFELAKS